MAIFNEAYIELILETKTKKEKFKEKYHYVPDKDSADGTVGTITVDGKKYKVDISGVEKTKDENGKTKTTDNISHAKMDSSSMIYLDKNFFKLKGSHGNERMDALLKHEIGHQKLHNTDPDNKTVDPENRSSKMFRKGMNTNINKQVGNPKAMSDDNVRETAKKIFKNNLSGRQENIINHAPADMVRELIYRNCGEDKYLKDSSKEDQDRRDSDYNKAKKYERTDKSFHSSAEEFEADRYAANHSSERAVRKAFDNSFKIKTKDASAKKNQEAEADFAQRKKALKDDDLRKAKTYK